jgi:integrase
MIRQRQRKQNGTRFETSKAFFLRYYVSTATGRQKTSVKLADKSDTLKTWADVEHLIEKELARVNDPESRPVHWSLADFVEQKYLPYVEQNMAAVTVYSYGRLWARWKDHLGQVALENLQTADVSRVLTEFAIAKASGRTLSHAKWFLSGVYVFAIAQGFAKENPAFAATWHAKVARKKKQQPQYSLQQMLAMLAVLEPRDIRAAVAVALGYFAALRPNEIRGLRWEDYDGQELQVSRTVWRQIVGETKTEDSAASVPVIEPLRGLLEKLGTTYGKAGYILQSYKHTPLDLNSLNCRVIAPTLEKAGITYWAGFYAGRRGISSLVTNTSKNALNSTGLLRHSNPSTTLRHYTRAQKESIKAALEQVEAMATKAPDTVQ